MTIQEAQQGLVFQLYHIYDNREAGNIADLVLEHLTGWKKIDRILNKHLPLLPETIQLLEKYTADLLAHMPVQYVLNEAWFYGLKFFVNNHVLIPRPETEELVEWIVKTVTPSQPAMENIHCAPDLTLFDIGTGSGCIPIALKKQLPSTTVYACDVSKNGLEVARKNATKHQTDVGFLHINFLDPVQWEHLPYFDIIVSNPPYIPLKEKRTISPNVLHHEPHLALFVENEDPLIFYSVIADFAKEKMRTGGNIFVEIHEKIGNEVQLLFAEKGFVSIELKKDMQGKDRMIRVRS